MDSNQDFIRKLKDSIETRFNRFKGERVRCPSLKQMAVFIEQSLGYEAVIEHGYTNTDTHPKGVRWRIPGKGREGNKLIVRPRGWKYGDDIIFSHNSSETYRHNTEVAEWILRQLKSQPPPS